MDTTQTLFDDCFTVKQSRWKTWSSYDTDDNKILTSLTEELCVDATRFYLKLKQDGFSDSETRTYDGVVGGKL